MRNPVYISPLWIITILAFAAGGYLSWQWLVKQGPEITISFEDASGLVPGQSSIYFRGAKIGKVTDISLDNTSMALVTARMQNVAEPLLKEGAEFWISRPQLDFQGIRNLSTIATGSTIQIKAGSGKLARHFSGSDQMPLDDELADGLHIVLKADRLGSIVVGSPVTFRDLKTGEVTHLEISENANSVQITARIYRKYARLIQEHTLFWDDGGLHMNVHVFGDSNINIPALKDLVGGKIAFTNQQNGKPAKNGQVFQLLSEVPEQQNKKDLSMPWKQDSPPQSEEQH